MSDRLRSHSEAWLVGAGSLLLLCRSESEQPLARTQLAQGRDHYLYYNGHGDLAAEADASGSRTALHTYDPFGAPTDTQPTDQTVHRYTGAWAKQYDTASSLILMGARPYDPNLGRFLAVDPIDGGSLNNYDYAGQDPINGFDLTGRVRCSESCDGGGGGSGGSSSPSTSTTDYGTYVIVDSQTGEVLSGGIVKVTLSFIGTTFYETTVMQTVYGAPLESGSQDLTCKPEGTCVSFSTAGSPSPGTLVMTSSGDTIADKGSLELDIDFEAEGLVPGGKTESSGTSFDYTCDGVQCYFTG